MKKSYELLGVYWDHRPAAKLPSSVAYLDEGVLPAEHPECLFDSPPSHRYLRITTLFAVNDDRECESRFKQVSWCDEVYLLLDYTPVSPGTILKDYYRRRVGQVLYAAQSTLPDTKVRLALPCGKDGAC